MKVAPIAGFVVLEGPACANTGAGRTSPRTSFNGRTNADRLKDFRNDRREEGKRGTPSRVWCLIQSAATFIVNGFLLLQVVGLQPKCLRSIIGKTKDRISVAPPFALFEGWEHRSCWS